MRRATRIPIARVLVLAFAASVLLGPGIAAAAPDLQAAVDEAHRKYRTLDEGENADYIPVLARVPSNLFGVVIVTVDGKVYAAGDSDYPFSIQSVAKPFTAALVIEEQGVDVLREKVGVEPTGLPFNSIVAIELNESRTINPLVNAGAIATVSLVDAKGADARWKKILDWYGALAGEKLSLLDEVYVSEAETNYRNRAIANLLYSYGRLYSDPAEATDVYTKQGSVGVTARQLAMMGATIANGGKNPKTGAQPIAPGNVPELLALMTMAGFYDEAGLWAYTAGLPAKTGVGGGIVAVVPGEMSLVGFSPRLNAAGNSVRALRAIEHLSRTLGLGIFGPNP